MILFVFDFLLLVLYVTFIEPGSPIEVRRLLWKGVGQHIQQTLCAIHTTYGV